MSSITSTQIHRIILLKSVKMVPYKVMKILISSTYVRRVDMKLKFIISTLYVDPYLHTYLCLYSCMYDSYELNKGLVITD